MKEYYVYILRCRDGTFYTGVTSDYEERVAQHVSVGDIADKADGGVIVDFQSLNKTDDNIHIYVGLGGHACYPEKGETSWLGSIESHDGDGVIFQSQNKVRYIPRVGELQQDSEYSWLLYSGYWGDKNLEQVPVPGDTAPRGPIYSASGLPVGMRWNNPWDWSMNMNNSTIE